MNALRFRMLPCLAFVALLHLPAAGQVYSKPPSPAGGLHASSWVTPDGSDADMYAWDDFTLATTETITEVSWRGGYAYDALYGMVVDFRVSIFESNAGGFEPLIVALPEHENQEITVTTFHTNGSAGETYAGVFGGKAMYDYRAVLPTPVTLVGGQRYWLRVLGEQPTYPDWAMAHSAVGDGSYFRYSTGMHMFQFVPGNLAFSLYSSQPDPLRKVWRSTRAPSPILEPVVLPMIAQPWTPVVLWVGLTPSGAPALQPIVTTTDASGSLVWSFDPAMNLAPGTELFVRAFTRDARGHWRAGETVSWTVH